MRRPLTSSQELLGQYLPNLVRSISRVRRKEIVNFMIPHPKGDHILVKLYFLNRLLLYINYTFEYIVIMIKEGSTKIVNFMTPKVGILVLEGDQISHLVKMHYSFKNIFYTPRGRSDKLSIY